MTTKAKTPSFEQAIKELEEIVAQIESGQTSLEDSLNQYKKGMELVKFCQDKLAEVEQQVKIFDTSSNSLKDFSV